MNRGLRLLALLLVVAASIACSSLRASAVDLFVDPPIIDLPGSTLSEFAFDVSVDNVPAPGLGTFGFQLGISCGAVPVAGSSSVLNVFAAANSVTVASGVKLGPPTRLVNGGFVQVESGLGPMILNAVKTAAVSDGLLAQQNETFTNGLARFAMTLQGGAVPSPVPQVGRGAVLQFRGFVGASVAAGTVCQINIAEIPGNPEPGLVFPFGSGTPFPSVVVASGLIRVGSPCAGAPACGDCTTRNQATCACDPKPVGAACNSTDSDLCTTQACDGAGACATTTVTCPNNPCVKDSCNPASGVCEPELAGTVCATDTDLCTTQTCNGSGACQVSATVTCPNDQCIKDSCNPATGTCGPEPADTPCQTDSDLCTTQACNGSGTCAVKTTVTCPNDPCVKDTCDPGTGTCAPEPQDTACETDSDLCTTQACNGSGTCQVKDTVTCPNSPCIKDSCNPTSGTCDPEQQGTTCDTDADSCTSEACDGTGQCLQTGANPACNDENCTNGIDDDADNLTDGADPDCNAKDTLKCQKSIGAAGQKLLNLGLVRTKGCSGKLLAAQLAGERDADPAAEAEFRSAIDSCDKEIGKLIDTAKGDRAKTIAKIAKDCGAVLPEVMLQSSQGLGIGSLAAQCTSHGITLNSASNVARCLDAIVVGLSAGSGATAVPRSCELLHRAETYTAPVTGAARPGALEDATRAYLAEIDGALDCSGATPTVATPSPQDTSVLLGCQMKIESAVRNYVRKVSAGVLSCVDGLLTPKLTAETGGDPKDKFQKGLDNCDKQLAKVFLGDKSAQQKAAGSIRDGCSALGGSEIVQAIKGLGFEELTARCTGELGITLDDAESVIECLDKTTISAGARVAASLKPRACELVDLALASPPCGGGAGKSCLDDATRTLLTQLRPGLCTP